MAQGHDVFIAAEDFGEVRAAAGSLADTLGVRAYLADSTLARALDARRWGGATRWRCTCWGAGAAAAAVLVQCRGGSRLPGWPSPSARRTRALPWPPMPRAGRCCCASTTGAGIFTCARCRWPSATTGCCGPAPPILPFAALSALPAGRPVWWDEYQKQGRAGEQSVLRVVLAHAALRTAYYLLLATVPAVCAGRERGGGSASFPSIKPLPNTTLLFTRTVAGLYQQGRNHARLPEKENRPLSGLPAHPLSGAYPRPGRRRLPRAPEPESRRAAPPRG
ncbi:MAG: hypothetical protein WKG07_09635 [Hymenobacter sp.]